MNIKNINFSLALSVFACVVVIIAGTVWFVSRQDTVYTEEVEECIEPEHVVEADGEYTEIVEVGQVSLAPIRKNTTIDKGDSFFKIMMGSGISQTQAYDIHKSVKGVFDLSRMLPGHGLVLIFSPDNQDLKGLEYAISDVEELVVAVSSEGVSASILKVERILHADYDGPLKQFDFKLKKGDSIYSLLHSCGVCDYQIDTLIRSVKREYNLSDIAPGQKLSVWVTEQTPERLARLTYEIDALNLLDIIPGDGVFKAGRQTFDVDVRYERADGAIASSLYESAVHAGLSPEVVMELTDIFAWDINFFIDIRTGDTYTVLYEKYFVKDQFKGYGRVLAARFVNQGDEHVAVYYDNGKGTKGYYDDKGGAIRKLFLKAPLNYRRISSGFTYKRMHPIFHVVRPHLGVDYAAPTGTPIVALGDGKVLFKGWSNGFGNAIRIKHSNGYVTYYGHLSRFARGLRKGIRVDQGQVIGYVGSTGHSTGPHLDFRVRLNKKFLNPLKLKQVTGPPLKGNALTEFRKISAKRLAMLDDTSLNIAMSDAGKIGVNP